MSGRHAPVVDAEVVSHRRRADVWFAVAVVCGVAVLAWVVITMQQLSHDLSTANQARDALARQVQHLGASPVAGPPGSRGEQGSSVVGPRGRSGAPGSPGPSGSPGTTGASGKAGAVGASGSPGAAGASGSPGAVGAVGATGPAGPAGERGADGKDGTDGRDGADGKDGTNGSPPAGWSYTDPAGVEYSCVPVDDFDASSPRYTCAPTSTPSPSDTPTPSGLGLTALIATATYRRLGGQHV